MTTKISVRLSDKAWDNVVRQMKALQTPSRTAAINYMLSDNKLSDCRTPVIVSDKYAEAYDAICELYGEETNNILINEALRKRREIYEEVKK